MHDDAQRSPSVGPRPHTTAPDPCASEAPTSGPEQVLGWVDEKVRELPKLPTGVARVAALLQDPDSDPDEVERLIRLDPGLTAFVLATANSAAFGARAEISSVRAAWMRLGSSRVLAAVISSAVQGLASRAVSGYDLDPGALWEGSVASAIATEELANLLGTRAPAEAFTAGLLADLGKLVIGELAAEFMVDVAAASADEQLSFETAEARVLGVNHAEVGALMLEAWGLPMGLVEIVRWHHDPGGCPEPWRETARLVHLAQHICVMAGLGAGVDADSYVACAESVQRAGLSDELTEQCLILTSMRLEAAREAFQLPPKAA